MDYELAISEYNRIIGLTLPTVNKPYELWSREEDKAVEDLRDVFLWVWYGTEHGDSKIDNLLDKLSTYFNRDGGWIYQGDTTKSKVA